MKINSIKVPKALEIPVQTLFVTGKTHPNYYNGRGSHTSRSANYAEHLYYFLLDAMKLEPRHLLLGNDAPRGGHTGAFVELTSAGKRLKIVKESVQAFRQQAAQEAAAEAEASRIRNEAIVLRERRYADAGGEAAALAWFETLPEQSRGFLRGYVPGYTKPPYSKSLCKRIREAFKQQLA